MEKYNSGPGGLWTLTEQHKEYSNKQNIAVCKVSWSLITDGLKFCSMLNFQSINNFSI